MRRTSFLRATVAAAMLTSALSPLGSTAQVGSLCPTEPARSRPDGWVQLARPAWTSGGEFIKSWAASPVIDGYLLSTNGSSITRTVNGGCTWDEVFTPRIAVGESNAGSLGTIEAVALPPSPQGRVEYLSWAVVSEPAAAASYVVTSADRGETWERQPSVGLPPLTRLHALHVGPDPRIAYLVGDAKRGSIVSTVETMLYVTRDGGATFEPVRRGLDASQYTQIVLDPIHPQLVWAWDADALYHSKDAGATFTKVNVPGPISAVDVRHYPAHEPARIVAYRADRASASESTDGGVTWKPVSTPGRVTGAATLNMIDALATTSEDGVHIYAPAFNIARRDVSPRRLVLNDVAWSSDGVRLTLYGGTEDDLYLRRFDRQLDPLPPVELHAPTVHKQGPTGLRPANMVVTLRPGERRTIDYRLNLSPVPTPIDVFFATDSTGSMQPVIASLRKDLQDIIDDLGRSGIDVWFGVGDFKDYPTFGSPGDHPYKRFREVGPIDEDLERAIESIRIGGGRGLDSALTATYQAASGEGQAITGGPGTPSGPNWVEPGQDAGWRENSLRVLVIAADVRSRDPQNDPGYPGPSYAQVIRKLNDLRVEHVGLAVGNFPQEPHQSLSKVSAGTNTVAPPGGTDCDDDGKVDIEAGAPLVCVLPLKNSAKAGTNLAPAMVGLLSALEDLQPVTLDLTGDRRVAEVAGVRTVAAVNVKGHNQLDYAVDVTCATETAGATYKYSIEGKVAERTVAATALTVVCEGLPVVPPPADPRVPPVVVEEDFPPPAVRALAAAAVPPPPAPPAPVPQPQPQANPNANPNPQVVPQAGMAYQEQVQLGLAVAHAEMDIEEEELAMSGLRDGDAATAVLCAGMVLSAGAAVGLRRRLRTQPVPARVRSSG